MSRKQNPDLRLANLYYVSEIRISRDLWSACRHSFPTALMNSSGPGETLPKRDVYPHDTLWLLCRSGGTHQQGKMDMTIGRTGIIYIFEFKFNSSADIALKQIEDMGYADKFNDDSREVVCIGANYCSKERNVNSWRIK